MLTGHMIPFLEPLGSDKCLVSDNKLHGHSQYDQEGLECTLVGHLEEIGCLKEYFVIFNWQAVNSANSKVTDLFGKEITLATTLLTDFLKLLPA